MPLATEGRGDGISEGEAGSAVDGLNQRQHHEHGHRRLWDAADLRTCVGPGDVKAGELVWVQVSTSGTTSGRLGRTLHAARRVDHAQAHIVLLGEAEARPYLATPLVPVRDVVDVGVLDLPAGAAEMVLALAADAGFPAVPDHRSAIG